MVLSDTRGARLRALDAKLFELAAETLGETGDHGASLCDLAMAVADSVSLWREIMPRVRVKRSLAFEPAVAGILAIESVFDGLIEGPSLGVLVAAFELAISPG